MGATMWWQYSSPNSLPNLEVWYNASSGDAFNKTTSITNGTAVTSWQNFGGLTSHDWNSLGGKRPVWYSNQKNGLGAVRFVPSGSQSLSINPITYIQALPATTMVLVYKTANTGSGTRICTTSDSGGYRWGQTANTLIGAMAGGNFTLNGVTADTDYHHVVIKFDGSQTGNANRVKVRYDAIETPLTFSSNVNLTTSASASYFYGGVDSNGSSNYWDGDILELMIFTRALNDGEIATIEQYITTKWNI